LQKKGAISRNVIVLGIVSPFTDISPEMIFGLLPLFLTGPLGASRTLLGLIEGKAETLGYTVRMASGVVSGKVEKRKPLVILGYALSAVNKLFLRLQGSGSTLLL